MSLEGSPKARHRRARRLVLLGAVLALPLALAAGLALWPGETWHRGPLGQDLESEQAGAPMTPILAAVRPAGEALNARAAANETEIEPAVVRQTLRVERGDTLMGMLVEAGIDRGEAHEAITALRKVFRPRDLRPGQGIELSLAPAAEPRATGTAETPRNGAAAETRLISLGLQPSVERDVLVTREGGTGFVALAINRPLIARTVGSRGTIETNLSVAGSEAGMPAKVLTDLIRMFSFDVDFQRDIQRGDSFEVVYDAKFEDSGAMALAGDIVYAAMTLSGKRMELYRFTPKSGRTDYFDPKGDSVRKTLMRTPIDGARLSSGYGMRKHPILGYTKMHRGVDFAAPRGTPIYAAGDGTVEVVGRKGAYGKYVRIRHNSTYKTAYAHMSRYAKGIRKGKRVKQGQVIGYVGSTGRSTGPHLHYEILVNGRQINPRRVKLPSGEKLKGQDLETFAARRAEIDAARAQIFRTEALMVEAVCAEAAGAEIPPASGCPAAKTE